MQQGNILQIDPYSPHERPADRFIHAQPPLDEATLPTNFVLLTHAHGDHTNSETIARIHQAFPEAQYIGPSESIQQIIRDTDVIEDQTLSIQAGDQVSFGGWIIHVIYAKPPGRRS